VKINIDRMYLACKSLRQDRSEFSVISNWRHGRNQQC